GARSAWRRSRCRHAWCSRRSCRKAWSARSCAASSRKTGPKRRRPDVVTELLQGRSVSLRALVRASLVLVWGVAAGCAPRAPEITQARVAFTPARHLILISFDGFRYDYIDRPAAQNLRALAARGVRAERMIPSFPSKT